MGFGQLVQQFLRKNIPFGRFLNGRVTARLLDAARESEILVFTRQPGMYLSTEHSQSFPLHRLVF